MIPRSSACSATPVLRAAWAAMSDSSAARACVIWIASEIEMRRTVAPRLASRSTSPSDVSATSAERMAARPHE